MKKLTYAMLGAVSALLIGCGAVENAIDCASICNRYKDCYKKDYDSSACQTRCRENANSDSSYMSKASSCQACMDDKSCAAAAFSCPPCLGIVP